MAPDTITTVVENLLQSLTIEEKVALVAGQNMWQTTQVERLGIPPLQMTDGPAGARGTKWTDGSLTTLIPCAISLAATWDPSMVKTVSTILGQETRRKGCHVLLAPTMNFSRSPLGGRNFEGYGEDPFLIGTMSTEMIRGIQSEGVGACMKHFILNDTETRRFNVNQIIDERTLREVYMKPFFMAAEASPWTAMVSYPLINGTHADMSPFILPRLLRDELQFDRLVMSDWGGCNDTVQSMIAGTDLEMPGPPVRRGERLLTAIHDGLVDEVQHLNPSVRRVLQLLEKANLLPSQTKDTSSEEASNDIGYHDIVREAAESGLVLLKNDGLLPLQPSSLTKVAILGPNAHVPTAGGSGSAAVNPFYITTPEESLERALREVNPAIEISYEQGVPFSSRPALLGDALTVPDGSRQGLQVDFFAGHEFQGPIVATSFWANSLTYMMSDGDVPQSLKDNQYCYRASGSVTLKVSGQYVFSIANTGKAKLFLDDKLIIDNTDWAGPTAEFLGCSSKDQTCYVDLSSGRSYALRVDNVVTLPLMESFDNTLFPRMSGLRIGMSLQVDETEMLNRAVKAAQESDVAILVVGHNKDSEGEGGDRPDMDLPGRTNELVSSICAANPNTIVVVQTASATAMPWTNQANAIVLGWYQGQENGPALANALLGICNFSGQTPITFPNSLSDHGSSDWFPAEAAQDHAVFGEQVLIGYRWFEEREIEPLWPFGFGLSYTSFTLSNIHLSGTMTTMPESHVTIHITVNNIGQRDGHEVVQVFGYLQWSLEMREFIKSDTLRWYDEEIASWRVDTGSYKCFVGTSVKDIKCELAIDIV
ncbi:uncharacterized protein N7500_001153 [Penicillium coprophilum]|uniref:uncharacterized protein n=1 Tax=Penicillium coprophilum TaxID=36646 RepID=UPI0023A25A55|nr:uncharacterized protein N7500_001153 [Penicillium coprophilum]KAJ5178454.1 hypothetical protein N7500_001153 [Penicillium coprophilum]